jgi:hypothetical protein
MVYIYVIRLENNKYYVGKTKNPTFRLRNHFNEYGSAWTKKYRPIIIHELVPECDNFDEDKYTIKYMTKFGIDNVRGGSFCQLKLDASSYRTLRRMINGSSDKCYKCNKEDHYVNECDSVTYTCCELCGRNDHETDICWVGIPDKSDESDDFNDFGDMSELVDDSDDKQTKDNVKENKSDDFDDFDDMPELVDDSDDKQTKDNVKKNKSNTSSLCEYFSKLIRFIFIFFIFIFFIFIFFFGVVVLLEPNFIFVV